MIPCQWGILPHAQRPWSSRERRWGKWRGRHLFLIIGRTYYYDARTVSKSFHRFEAKEQYKMSHPRTFTNKVWLVSPQLSYAHHLLPELTWQLGVGGRTSIPSPVVQLIPMHHHLLFPRCQIPLCCLSLPIIHHCHHWMKSKEALRWHLIMTTQRIPHLLLSVANTSKAQVLTMPSRTPSELVLLLVVRKVSTFGTIVVLQRAWSMKSYSAMRTRFSQLMHILTIQSRQKLFILCGQMYVRALDKSLDWLPLFSPWYVTTVTSFTSLTVTWQIKKRGARWCAR